MSEETCKVNSVIGTGSKRYTIPRKQRLSSEDCQQGIPLDSREAKEIINTVHHLTWDSAEEFDRNFVISKVYKVENQFLEREFQTKRTELREDGRSTKELSEHFAFNVEYYGSTVKEQCKMGVYCNGSNDILGDGSMGVSVWRCPDLCLKSLVWPDTWAVFLILFRIVKGRVKPVTPNQRNQESKQEPTPNYDCHVSKNVQHAPAADIATLMAKTQYYLYEYDEEGLPRDRPRHCLPFAVIHLKKAIPVSPETKQPAKVAMPIQLINEDVSDTTVQEKKGHYLTENDGKIAWRGLIGSKESSLGVVAIMAGHKLGLTLWKSFIEVKNKLPLDNLVKVIPGDMRTAWNKPLRYREHIFSLCVLKPCGPTDKFINFIKSLSMKDHAAGVVTVDSYTVMFLVPSSKLAVDLGFCEDEEPWRMFCIVRRRLRSSSSNAAKSCLNPEALQTSLIEPEGLKINLKLEVPNLTHEITAGIQGMSVVSPLSRQPAVRSFNRSKPVDCANNTPKRILVRRKSEIEHGYNFKTGVSLTSGNTLQNETNTQICSDANIIQRRRPLLSSSPPTLPTPPQQQQPLLKLSILTQQQPQQQPMRQPQLSPTQKIPTQHQIAVSLSPPLLQKQQEQPHVLPTQQIQQQQQQPAVPLPPQQQDSIQIFDSSNEVCLFQFDRIPFLEDTSRSPAEDENTKTSNAVSLKRTTHTDKFHEVCRVTGGNHSDVSHASDVIIPPDHSKTTTPIDKASPPSHTDEREDFGNDEQYHKHLHTLVPCMNQGNESTLQAKLEGLSGASDTTSTAHGESDNHSLSCCIPDTELSTGQDMKNLEKSHSPEISRDHGLQSRDLGPRSFEAYTKHKDTLKRKSSLTGSELESTKKKTVDIEDEDDNSDLSSDLLVVEKTVPPDITKSGSDVLDDELKWSDGLQVVEMLIEQGFQEIYENIETLEKENVFEILDIDSVTELEITECEVKTVKELPDIHGIHSEELTGQTCEPEQKPSIVTPEENVNNTIVTRRDEEGSRRLQDNDRLSNDYNDSDMKAKDQTTRTLADSTNNSTNTRHTSLANTRNTSLTNTSHTGLTNSSHTGLANTCHTSLTNTCHTSLTNTCHTSLTNTCHTGLTNTSHIGLTNTSHTGLTSTSHISPFLDEKPSKTKRYVVNTRPAKSVLDSFKRSIPYSYSGSSHLLHGPPPLKARRLVNDKPRVSHSWVKPGVPPKINNSPLLPLANAERFCHLPSLSFNGRLRMPLSRPPLSFLHNGFPFGPPFLPLPNKAHYMCYGDSTNRTL